MTTQSHNTHRLPATHVEHDVRPNFNRRRMVAGLAVAALAVGAVKAGQEVVSFVKDHTGHEYTSEELNKMPYTAVTVEPNEGPEQIIRQVEPSLLGDGQGRADMIDFIDKQGLAKDHMLQQGQQVIVPLVPGMKHNVQPTDIILPTPVQK
jgi:hypothetical protein